MDESVNDVLIVGAGPVGAVCALALAQQGVAARVLEAQQEDARADTRTLALAHGSRLISSGSGCGPSSRASRRSPASTFRSAARWA